MEGSDLRHSFHHIGTDGSLYVFEAPIDMLSYITLHPEDWQHHSYVSCCGISIQPVLKMLERVPQRRQVLNIIDAKDRMCEVMSIDSFIAGFELAWQISVELSQQETRRAALYKTLQERRAYLILKKKEEAGET